MTFRVGQQVECIIKNHWVRAFGSAPVGCLPIESGVYTVSGVHVAAGRTWIALEGFPRFRQFADQCFRPLFTPEPGFGVFERIIEGVNKRDTVRA